MMLVMCRLSPSIQLASTFYAHRLAVSNLRVEQDWPDHRRLNQQTYLLELCGLGDLLLALGLVGLSALEHRLGCEHLLVRGDGKTSRHLANVTMLLDGENWKSRHLS